jgi:AGZA family xanthine/uracil permease-like MFS transporter
MPTLALLAGDPDMPIVKQYQMALSVVLISGVLFVIISVAGLREAIINGIPKNIKLALGSGVGLFITLLGLRNAGIVEADPNTFVTLVSFSDITTDIDALGAVVALVGLFLMAALTAMKIKGAILIGILATTLLSYIVGYSKLPESFTFNLAERGYDFVAVSLFKMDFTTILSGGNLGPMIGSLFALILAFMMVNMFDSMGTIFGVASSAGLVNEKGEVIGLRKGLMCDAAGSVIGAVAGTSTTTTVVESSAGIHEGGRTGLTSFTTGILFICALFLAPFIDLVPSIATAPALVFVGGLMIASIKDVNFKDPAEALPAFLTVVMMPMTFSIANGIAFGLISYVIIKLLTGRVKEIKPATIIVAFLFILQYVLG